MTDEEKAAADKLAEEKAAADKLAEEVAEEKAAADAADKVRKRKRAPPVAVPDPTEDLEDMDKRVSQIEKAREKREEKTVALPWWAWIVTALVVVLLLPIVLGRFAARKLTPNTGKEAAHGPGDKPQPFRWQR